jgi:hypothetical protein
MAAAHHSLKGSPVNVLWQCGKFYEGIYGESDTAQLPNVRMSAFIDRMDLLYAAADVIIFRAGALSISELCLVGKTGQTGAFAQCSGRSSDEKCPRTGGKRSRPTGQQMQRQRKKC